MQSLHRAWLTRAILAQPAKPEWYLRPRGRRRRRDDISTSFTFHVAPLGDGAYSETRRLRG